MINKIWMLLISIPLVGCSYNHIDTEGLNMDYNIIEQFQTCMDNDEVGDKKSVFWDGKEVQIVLDEMDDLEIQDGRGEFASYTDIEKESWSFKLTADEYKILADSDELYQIEGANWYLEIKKVDYSEAEQQLKSDPNMKDVSSEDLSTNISQYNKQSSLYRGLKTVNNKSMAGYILILNDYFEHSYQLSYFGTGNMNVIRSNGLGIFNSFIIDINLE